MGNDSLTLSERYDRDAWLAELCNDLSEDFMVVASPVVQRVTLPAVVINPQGITVLHLQRRAQETDADLASTVQFADKAIHSYLRDEFPHLRIKIRHLVVLSQPASKPAKLFRSRGYKVVLHNELARTITAQVPHTTRQNLDHLTRDAIATSLLKRPLSRNQRATMPFVFRSGNVLGGDRRAWTLRQLFSHLARYPADGVYHMENGTLERWLNEQGAPDLARLVLELSHTDRENPRASLEELLGKSGLAKPSGIGVHPRSLDLKRVITGHKVEQTFRIYPLNRVRYITVTLKADAAWLQLDPEEVKGGGATVHVHADTTHLPIQDAPYVAHVVLSSPLLTDPMIVPVKVCVTGLPSLVKRAFLRPAVGFLSAAIIGATIGLAMGMWGMRPPSGLMALVPTLSSGALWAILFGTIWALGGLVRGFRQPPASSTGREILRWLGSTALWFIPLGILAVTTAWALGVVNPALIKSLPALPGTLVLGALGLAIIPTVLERDRNLPRQIINGDERSHSRRHLKIAVTAMVLAVVIIGSILLFPSVWTSDSLGKSGMQVTDWFTTQVTNLRSWLDHTTEQYYLTRYDRRAPSKATPIPSKQRPTPTAE